MAICRTAGLMANSKFICVVFIFVHAVNDVSSEEVVGVGLQGRRVRPVSMPGIQFARSYFQTTVLETSSIGSTVIHIPVTTSHPEYREHVTFSLKRKLSEKETPPFAIDPNTGVISTIASLKNLTKLKYTLVVHAKLREPIHNQISTRVIVRVISLPKFPPKGLHGYINENVVGNVNATVVAKCATAKLQRSVRYILTRVEPEGAKRIFRVSKVTGVVSVLYPLDYEEINTYKLTVRAKTGRIYSETTYVVHVIDENDNVPKFPFNILYINITENQELIDHPLSHLHADIANDIIGSQATEYRLHKGGKDIIDIDKKTGQLFNTGTIDFEHYSRFNLIVRAYHGDVFSQARVVINILDTNDNVPTLQDFRAYVNYFQGKTGWTGFWIPAKDADVNDRLKFKVIEGGQTDDGKDLITVDSNGLARLGKSEIALSNNETISTTMYISVTDGIHTIKTHCTIELTMVTEEMTSHSFKLRLFDVTQEEMLTVPGLHRFRNAIAEIFRVNPMNVFAFNLEAIPYSRDTYITMTVRDNNGKFFSVDSSKTSLYLSSTKLESRLGFRFEQVHEDPCITKQCFNYQVCQLHRSLYDTSMLFSEGHDVVYAGLLMSDETQCVCPPGYGGADCSEQLDLCLASNPCQNGGECSMQDGEVFCDCPLLYKGNTCEQSINVCEPDFCKNGGECITRSDGTFQCVCKTGYDGIHCEVTSRHFTGDSYLAFPSLQSRKSLNISFSLQTSHKDGMLMYIGRYNHRRDFLALEIVDSNLVLSFSFGQMTMRVLAGTAWGLDDQAWHTVSMVYHKKIVDVVVDNCRTNENELKVSNVPCKATATQSTKVHWFLDVTSPLLIGGLPGKDKDDRILTDGFQGCLQNVYIDGELMDFASNIMDKNTVAGCNAIGQVR
ncbi:cadherin EGF LAG seven-pass G-type receptor 1-like isoform X2 [Anneissia japonica]|nr:cadherin EGF LAG seven-pass G-type receptor 1-like isoform X2 [Anneissia japonica]